MGVAVKGSYISDSTLCPPNPYSYYRFKVLSADKPVPLPDNKFTAKVVIMPFHCEEKNDHKFYGPDT